MNRRELFRAIPAAAAALAGLSLAACAPKRFPWPGENHSWQQWPVWPPVPTHYRGYSLWQAAGNRDALFVCHYRGDHWGLQPVCDPSATEYASLKTYVDEYLLG